MKVKSLMRKNPKTVILDTPLSIIWNLLGHKQLHMLPVVDEENRLKGIITAEDLLKNLVPDYRQFFEEYYPNAPTIEDIEEQIEKQKDLDDLEIPGGLNFSKMNGLSNEVIEKLTHIRPTSIGQAARISGMTPGAITSLLVGIKKHQFQNVPRGTK